MSDKKIKLHLQNYLIKHLFLLCIQHIWIYKSEIELITNLI